MKFDLKSAVTRLEDSIITLSGPALAISGIIAGVDLLTGGSILKDAPGLALAWAICLLLTLDFQVLALGVRTRRIYMNDKAPWRKGIEIAIAVLVAAGISFVSIQMQSIIARMNGADFTIDQAAAQLGINTLALIWERSILVLVLIFMSGWFRDSSDHETPETVSETPATISDETMQLILAKLVKLDDLEHAITAQHQAIVIETETPIALLETPEIVSETELDEPALDAQIATLLTINPDVSSRDAAVIVGRPHTTVYRVLNRMKQPKQM